ncbi:MAG: hypothetical protein ACKPKW_06785, partial [Dolichospermum sp.]
MGSCSEIDRLFGVGRIMRSDRLFHVCRMRKRSLFDVGRMKCVSEAHRRYRSFGEIEMRSPCWGSRCSLIAINIK